MAWPRAARARLFAGGILWLTSAQFFVVQAWTERAWSGSEPYSLRRSWISDLGATTCGTYPGGGDVLVCSPRHALLNGGLAVLGGQVLLGAVLLRPLLRQTRYAEPTLFLLSASGVALPFAAAFPEDTGKPWHAIAATLHLAAAGLGTVAAGLGLRATGRRLAATVTFALGGTSVLGTLLTSARLGTEVGRGALERLAAWPFTLWTTLAGVLVLAGTWRQARQPPRVAPRVSTKSELG